VGHPTQLGKWLDNDSWQPTERMERHTFALNYRPRIHGITQAEGNQSGRPWCVGLLAKAREGVGAGEENRIMWRVKDWDKIFENNRSRVIENTTWVPMPNKHDSDGYLRLLDHDHGASHYGAWCALVQVASKCKPRGTLVRDGRSHTCDSLARQTRIGAHVFREAIPRFIESEIGWLEDVDDSCLTLPCRSADAGVFGPLSPNGTNGTERTEGMERKNTGRPVRSSGDSISDLPVPVSGPEPGAESGAGYDSPEWSQAREMRVAAVRKLWPARNWDADPLDPTDAGLLIRASYLAITRFGVRWWDRAIAETLAYKAGKKKIAVFKTMLWKLPKRGGIDLNALLDAIEIPPKPSESEVAKPALMADVAKPPPEEKA
jgi:hypothetical protein